MSKLLHLNNSKNSTRADSFPNLFGSGLTEIRDRTTSELHLILGLLFRKER